MSTPARTRLLFCDLLNLPRGKYLPKTIADRGSAGFARGAFGVTFDRDLLPVPGIGLFEGLPDMDLHLDNLRRDSWQSGTEIALGDLMVDGAPFGLCARSQLKRTVAEWEALGYSPKVGIELEAYVFEQDSEGVWHPYDTPGAFVYGTGPQNDPRGVMDEIWERAQACGLPIESMNGEYDNGQFELTLCFDDAVKACDDAFLFRTMAREIAFKKGLLLTFLPRPIPDRGGSGMHINFSLVDKDGNNATAPTGTLSEVAGHCIGGLIAHHEALAALCAPLVQSYNRLERGSLAGYWANWADDHRLTTVRTCSSSPKSARLEHRMSDCSANPYQAVTAVLQAAKLGVEAKTKLPPAEDLDGLEDVRATRHTPSSLGKALDALEKDKALQSAVGQLLCDALVVLKRDEVERLNGKSVDEIRDYYLPFV